MANTLLPRTENTILPYEPTPGRKRWTRKECEMLINSELLIGRYELIDGEIISKMGQNRPHSLTIGLIIAWLAGILGNLHVQSQLPIDVAGEDNEINEPEPDIAVLAQPITAFAERNPGPEDVLLLIEVSNSTLRFDLRNKALLYARAGIADYWVADVVSRRFVVHRNPVEGEYVEITEYAEDAILSLLARPDVSVRISDLLPPPPPQELVKDIY